MELLQLAIAINSAALLIVLFFLFFPLYLKESNSKYYGGLWRRIGELLHNHYGAVWVLNPVVSLMLGNLVFLFSKVFFYSLLTVIAFNFLISLCILWYPFFLKEKKPEKYKGFWKAVGNWLGEPKNFGKK